MFFPGKVTITFETHDFKCFLICLVYTTGMLIQKNPPPPPPPSLLLNDFFDVKHLIGLNQCKVVDLIIMFSENLKVTSSEKSGRICQIFYYMWCV